MSSQKKAPAKKEETQSQEAQETQPVENAVEQMQEQTASEETKKAVREEAMSKERKPERVITILSAEDSAYLSEFGISRSSLSRAVLRGVKDFITPFKDKTEAEITTALQAKLS